MVLVLSIASLALAAISAVSGRVVPRKTAPKNWDCELEPYNDYHRRYLDFDCQAHHHTQYFDQCCHPRLANETSVPFPSQCGCDEDDDDTSSSYSIQMTPTPTYVEPTPSESPQPEQPSDPSSSTSSTPEPSPSPTPSPVSPQPDQPSDSSSSTSSTPEPSPTPSPVSDVSNSGSNNSNSDVHTGGEATFFFQDGNPGACGQVHSDSDFICAMDQDLYGNAGNASPLCGKQVTITNTANGKTVTVTVADDCPTCSNANSIDLSVAAFNALGDESQGVLPISWTMS